MVGKAARKRGGEGDDDPLALTLAPPAPRCLDNGGARRVRRKARAGVDDDGGAGEGGPRAPPFPWATERPGRHETLESLLRRRVTSVDGAVRCKNKKCRARATVAYDLESRFRELRAFVDANLHAMNDRAPAAWMSPALPDCDACGQGVMWPEIADDNADINWLFLLLGQMLGCCTLGQLKYFCLNTGMHSTGAKDRVLYYAYVEMCNQLRGAAEAHNG